MGKLVKQSIPAKLREPPSRLPLKEKKTFCLIFEKMGLNAELLSSPSGVIVIGSSEEVAEAKSVVQLIAEQKQQFDTTEEKRNDSTFVRRVAGWSDEVFSSYLRDFLNEDQYSRVSISPSVSGYIVAGPVELLQSIEAEVGRLAFWNLLFYKLYPFTGVIFPRQPKS